jgi:hypothetical protein
MELLGIAIIMVIVIMGILLALRFFYLQPEENPAAAARDTLLGANLLDTMLETTTPCRDLQLVTLLQECGRGSGLVCGDATAPDGSVMVKAGSACDYAMGTIAFLLNQTLGTWQRHYEFAIDGPGAIGKRAINSPAEGCMGSSQAITRPRPIGPGEVMTVSLRLCQ